MTKILFSPVFHVKFFYFLLHKSLEAETTLRNLLFDRHCSTGPKTLVNYTIFVSSKWNKDFDNFNVNTLIAKLPRRVIAGLLRLDDFRVDVALLDRLAPFVFELDVRSTLLIALQVLIVIGDSRFLRYEGNDLKEISNSIRDFLGGKISRTCFIAFSSKSR